MECDLRLLQQFGPLLDEQLDEQYVRDLLIEKLLEIRVKDGGTKFLRLNRAQREYSQKL